MDCHFLSWCTLKPEVQAAWAQAILSVMAIFVAATMASRQDRRNRRIKIDNYVEMISLLASEAEHLVFLLKLEPGKVVASEANFWGRSVKMLDAIPFHEIPDFKLFSVLVDSRRCCVEIRDRYEIAMTAGNVPADAMTLDFLAEEARVLDECYEAAAEISNRLGGLNLTGNARLAWRKFVVWIKWKPRS